MDDLLLLRAEPKFGGEDAIDDVEAIMNAIVGRADDEEWRGFADRDDARNSMKVCRPSSNARSGRDAVVHLIDGAVT